MATLIGLFFKQFMLRNLIFNLLVIPGFIGSCFSQVPEYTSGSRLLLSHMKRNNKTKVVSIPIGNSIEVALQAPNDSLITFYDRTIDGKITAISDSTITLAATGSYRYVNYKNGSYLEDYYEYSTDSTKLETIRLDSIISVYAYRESLNYPRKVSVNLARIFIAVSTINALAGKGGTTNSIIFCLGVGAIFSENLMSGKKYRIVLPEKRRLRPIRRWKPASG